MLATGTITTLEGTARYEEVIKKSRFVGLAAHVSSPEEANAWVKEQADLKARHNCFAWRMADGSTRTNGDGEPGGTAGPPILAAIEGAGLHDVVVLVQRYRLGEGAKLGTGGLVRAYGGTAAHVLAAADTIDVEPKVAMVCEYELQDTGAVYNVLSAYSPLPTDDESTSTATSARLTFDCSPDLVQMLEERLRVATAGRALVYTPSEAVQAGTAEEGLTENAELCAASDEDKLPDEQQVGGQAEMVSNIVKPQMKATAKRLPAPQASRADDGDAASVCENVVGDRAPGSAATKSRRPSTCQQCGAVTNMLFQDESDGQFYCGECWKAYYDALDRPDE